MIRVLIWRASDPGHEEERTFKNLKGLIKYMKKTYHRWVIHFDYTDKGKKYYARLTIYDDYIE